MKVQISGYVTATHYSWDDKVTFSFHAFDPTSYDPNTVKVMEYSFEVEVPDNFDPRPGKVAALQEKKKALQAEFSNRVKELDEQINSLLAIEA